VLTFTFNKTLSSVKKEIGKNQQRFGKPTTVIFIVVL